MNLGLKNRSVIVCASSEGIARAAAEKFAEEGVRLAMCSRDAAKLNAAADAICTQHNAEVFARPLDVTDPKAVQQFVAEVAAQFGGIDVCVTNAGGPPPKPFSATTTEEWHRAIDLSFMSIVHCAHAVLPWMQKKQWGRLVTVTSVSVRQPVDTLVYSNSVRTGVLGLIKSLSNEYGKDGITVNNVAPGYTATERLRELARKQAAAAGLNEEQQLANLGEQTALKRVATAEEVADAIVWLASDRASYITGQTILVDGGLYKGL